MSLRRVRKRNGQEVPFEKAKIALAVRSAQNAVGEHDPLFADEVADLVELVLRRRYAWRGPARGGATEEPLFSAATEVEASDSMQPPETGVEAVPEIEEIQDLVEVGLVELGRAAVAKAYILYRDRRARVRDSLAEAAHREQQEGQLKHLRVRESRGTHPWSKGRIIAALVQEADLSRAQAEVVAARVESRVVASQLKRLSTALIRELVDNELVAMGLSGALARQAPVAIPRFDMRELLSEGEQSPVARRAALDMRGEGLESLTGLDLGRVLGGELLGRFALDDLFPDAIVEGHTCGALHIEDLRAPHLYLSQGLRSDLFLRGAPGPAAAFDALDEIGGQLAGVARGLVLESPAVLLRGLAKSSRSEDIDQLSTWLNSAAALARATGRRLDLASPGLKAVPFCARLVRALDEWLAFDPSKPVPRLFLDRGELAALLAASPELRPEISRLIEAGRLVPTWAPTGEQFIGPAGRRLPRELGGVCCGGAVSLNLARLAQNAGPWREDLFLEGLAHLIEQGVEALAALARFQREARATRPAEWRGRVAYAITPVGLAEALRLLGDGELRADQGARALGLLSEAARRFSSDRGLFVHLSPHYGVEAARRFAHADQAQRRSRQGLLFEGPGLREPAGSGEEGDARLSREYSRGYRLGARPGSLPGRGEAQLLATVPVGSWLPLDIDSRALQNTAGRPEEAQLAAWELFEDERETIRRSVSSAAEIPRTAPFFPIDAPSTDSAPRAS